MTMTMTMTLNAHKNQALNIRDCLYLRLSETLKAVGPFYLVSMPGEVKYPTQGVDRRIPCRGLHTSLNHSCVSPKMGCLEYLYYYRRRVCVQHLTNFCPYALISTPNVP